MLGLIFARKVWILSCSMLFFFWPPCHPCISLQSIFESKFGVPFCFHAVFTFDFNPSSLPLSFWRRLDLNVGHALFLNYQEN